MWTIFAGIAQVATGLGLLVILFAFLPGQAKPARELDFGAIKLRICRPLVFSFGALLFGVGAIASGSLSLIGRLI